MNPDEYTHMYEEEENHWWYVGMRLIVRSMLRPSSFAPHFRALDAGCGTGYSMGWLRLNYGCSVAGIDSYAEGLAFSRRRGERNLAQADVAALPFRSGVFDLVTSFDVLSHVRDESSCARALGEFFRVLKRGGVLLVRVAAYDWLRSSHDDEILTYHRFGRRELREAVSSAGFHISRATFANTFLFPGAVLWRCLKKLGVAPAGSDVRSSTRGPGWMNRTLLEFLALEAKLLNRARFGFPFGLSLFIEAVRKD